MWEAMNTLVQVSVVDSAQQGKTAAEGKNHLIHRRRTPQDRDGPLLTHFDLSFSENSLFSVYCFIKDYIGSQTAPEKIPSSAEVGHDVEPPAGSAASAGSNTVAIDNKIEQAMDLVKSHLMFAVREEVEVLKEKISELLERISQLEHENDILRANASAETLKQLNNQSHKKILSGQSVKPQPTPPQPSTT